MIATEPILVCRCDHKRCPAFRVWKPDSEQSAYEWRANFECELVSFGWRQDGDKWFCLKHAGAA